MLAHDPGSTSTSFNYLMIILHVKLKVIQTNEEEIDSLLKEADTCEHVATWIAITEPEGDNEDSHCDDSEDYSISKTIQNSMRKDIDELRLKAEKMVSINSIL